MEQNSIGYNRRAIIYSLICHSVLVAFMVNITVQFSVEIPQFYELTLGTVSQVRINQILDEARRAEISRRLHDMGISPEERIQTPSQKMIAIEEPSISIPSEQKIAADDIVSQAEKMRFTVSAPVVSIPHSDKVLSLQDRKETYQGSKITIGEQPGTGIETAKIGTDLIFTIEGELKTRDIILKPLPDYPEGLNKTAVITIRFSVLPDGSVSSSDMIPVRKENAVLEELTMNTLKRWRFSPLPDGDKRTQTGIITFIYKIK
jgi:periplasmic protein TonB